MENELDVESHPFTYDTVVKISFASLEEDSHWTSGVSSVTCPSDTLEQCATAFLRALWAAGFSDVSDIIVVTSSKEVSAIMGEIKNA